MVSQLVMRYGGKSLPTFDVVVNAGNDAPITFEKLAHDQRIPRLGSMDLIRLAEYAQTVGYVVDGFQLSDAYMTALSPHDTEPISAALTKAMRQHGARAVQDKLAIEFRSYVVVGVEFTTPSMGSLTIRRNGVTAGNEATRPEGQMRLTALLTNAWARMSFA